MLSDLSDSNTFEPFVYIRLHKKYKKAILHERNIPIRIGDKRCCVCSEIICLSVGALRPLITCFGIYYI